jgi:hypothetical protein
MLKNNKPVADCQRRTIADGNCLPIIKKEETENLCSQPESCTGMVHQFTSHAHEICWCSNSDEMQSQLL